MEPRAIYESILKAFGLLEYRLDVSMALELLIMFAFLVFLFRCWHWIPWLIRIAASGLALYMATVTVLDISYYLKIHH